MRMNQKRHRRVFAASLLIIGAMFIFFAPDHVWIGAVFFTIGILIELIAVWLNHRYVDKK